MTKQIMLECGCKSHAVRKVEGGYVPSCIIHNCITPMKVKPDLLFRKMRCSYYGQSWGRQAGPIYPHGQNTKCSRIDGCQCEVASDDTQPFFEFKGEGSRSAQEICKNCKYTIKAHERKKEKNEKHLDTVCDEFTQHGAFDFDKYYCGCSGWD